MKILMNENCNPLLVSIMKDFASESGATIEQMPPVERFTYSDNCGECGGIGFIVLHHENQMADNEREQCEECERLVELEKRADRLEDEIKGN